MTVFKQLKNKKLSLKGLDSITVMENHTTQEMIDKERDYRRQEIYETMTRAEMELDYASKARQNENISNRKIYKILKKMNDKELIEKTKVK